MCVAKLWREICLVNIRKYNSLHFLLYFRIILSQKRHIVWRVS